VTPNKIESVRLNPSHKKKTIGLTRRKADELIAILKERIQVVNKDPQYLYGVSRLAVFGSYLTDKEKLGDLDIAIELGPKNRVKADHWKLCDRQYREGRGSFMQQTLWPEQKVLRALRGRNHALSFHEYDELERLVQAGLAQGRELYRNKRYDRKSFFAQ
jgi:predicted nucleotidyltransferase